LTRVEDCGGYGVREQAVTMLGGITGGGGLGQKRKKEPFKGPERRVESR
jgi:hypothetical protein